MLGVLNDDRKRKKKRFETMAWLRIRMVTGSFLPDSYTGILRCGCNLNSCVFVSLSLKNDILIKVLLLLIFLLGRVIKYQNYETFWPNLKF